MKRAVVVFSGGQDSTTCLIQALTQYDEVHCITFDYGQRHRKEIDIARKLAFSLDVHTHKIVDIRTINTLVTSSLTQKNIPIPKSQEKKDNLPSTFVPGRNILFLTLASIYAYQLEAAAIITGICETDFSGYPDCRNDFIKTFNQAVNLGIAREICFITPLMWLNKAEIWALADYYKELNRVKYHTLTCYHGIKGDGCGQCMACYLRSRGLNIYQQQSKKVMASLKRKIKLN